MEESAYRAMQRMQDRHWWWRGMRRLYNMALVRFVPPGLSGRVLDVGCGFGANLPVLGRHGIVVGVDVESGALRAIRQRPELGLVQARADALPFRTGSFDVIGMLAVLEHVEDDRSALRETYRVAGPRATQVVLTSAYEVLWSHHDVANNHHRRYRSHQLTNRLRTAGWRVLVASYVNALVFPAVLVVRLAQRCLGPARGADYDTGPTYGPLNWLLEGILVIEGGVIIEDGFRLPFGVDLFVVSRRDG